MLPSDAKVAVIGAGPAGLMAAEVLAGQGVKVTVYDRMPSAGRKFLIAGRGGLNLTHSEDFSAFLGRYGDAAPEPRAQRSRRCRPRPSAPGAKRSGRKPSSAPAAGCFPNRSRRRRCCAPGSAAFRARAWNSNSAIAGPAGINPEICCSRRARARRPTPSFLRSAAQAGRSSVRMAAGRTCWANSGIAVTPLRPANCGFLVNWSDVFRERFEGQPLKRIELRFG